MLEGRCRTPYTSQGNTRLDPSQSLRPIRRHPRFHCISSLLFTSATFSVGSAFLSIPCISAPGIRANPFEKITPVHLLPLSRFSADIAFFSEDEPYRLRFDEVGILFDGDEKFELAIVQEDDLPDLSRFIVAAFGADAIRLSQDINAFERMLLSPATELVNGYSNLVAFAEVFQGTRQRLKSRFEKMDLSAPNAKGLSGKAAIEVVEKDSLVLVVARPSAEKDSQIEMIASIELRLQVSHLEHQFKSSTFTSPFALDIACTMSSISFPALRRQDPVQSSVVGQSGAPSGCRNWPGRCFSKRLAAVPEQFVCRREVPRSGDRKGARSCCRIDREVDLGVQSNVSPRRRGQRSRSIPLPKGRLPRRRASLESILGRKRFSYWILREDDKLISIALNPQLSLLGTVHKLLYCDTGE